MDDYEREQLGVTVFHLKQAIHELEALLRPGSPEQLPTPSKDENAS